MDINSRRGKIGTRGELPFLILPGKLIAELEKNCGRARVKICGFSNWFLKCLEIQKYLEIQQSWTGGSGMKEDQSEAKNLSQTKQNTYLDSPVIVLVQLPA